MLRADIPQPLLQSMLQADFPAVLQHYDRVHQELFSSSKPVFSEEVETPASNVAKFSLLESCKAFAYGRLQPTTGPRARGKKERSQRKKTAVWLSLAVASVLGFSLHQGILAPFLPGRYLDRGMLDDMEDE